MSLRDILFTSGTAVLLTPVILLTISLGFAQVMESNNYRIQSDSINFGGGLSSSTNYTLESTGGEIATGESSSASYNLKAGYQQMVSSYIAITAAASVVMSPSIPGLTGGTSNGSTSVIVTTDNPAGYTLSIHASSSPAMVSGANSILDYVPGGDPDFTFTTDASDSHFGFTPSGDDIADRFKDDGAACNTGALDTALACWDGLSTSPESIAERASANTPLGTETVIDFRVGIGGSVGQAVGIYTATTTLTAIAI